MYCNLFIYWAFTLYSCKVCFIKITHLLYQHLVRKFWCHIVHIILFSSCNQYLYRWRAGFNYRYIMCTIFNIWIFNWLSVKWSGDQDSQIILVIFHPALTHHNMNCTRFSTCYEHDVRPSVCSNVCNSATKSGYRHMTGYVDQCLGYLHSKVDPSCDPKWKSSSGV